MRALCRTLVLAVAVWAAPSPAFGQVAYTITDLGAFGNPNLYFDFPNGLNAAGQFTGYNTFAGAQRAIRAGSGVAPNSAAADLGTLGGAESFGLGINALGQVTGYSQVIGNAANHAFRTTPTGRVSDSGTDLGLLPGLPNSSGSGINASGQVAGNAYGSSLTSYRAFRTTSTGVITSTSDLGTFPGGSWSNASGINDSGQVVGAAATNMAGTASHAYRTAPNGSINAASDLGSFGTGEFDSAGWAINNSGQVTGIANSATFQHAFRTTPTGRISDPGTDLGHLGGDFSAGWAINNLGVVVGESDTNPITLDTHAFIYDTSMRDLNNLIPSGSGWLLVLATGINDAGQIVGFGELGGVSHAFLLTPVPEPSSFLLAGAAVAIGWARRRR